MMADFPRPPSVTKSSLYPSTRFPKLWRPCLQLYKHTCLSQTTFYVELLGEIALTGKCQIGEAPKDNVNFNTEKKVLLYQQRHLLK